MILTLTILASKPSVMPLAVGQLASEKTLSLFGGFVLIFMLNRYPMRVPPSPQLDFFGRLNNLYQIIAHVGVGLKFIGVSTEIFGALDEQHKMDFQIMNVLCREQHPNHGLTAECAERQRRMAQVGVCKRPHGVGRTPLRGRDYAGWIAIFSRLEHVPWLPKTLANTHVATGERASPQTARLCHSVARFPP